MPELSIARSDRIATTASRLRLVQFDFADQDPNIRIQYMAEELHRGLSTVATPDHVAFLRELRSHFTDASSPGAISQTDGSVGPSGADPAIVEFLDATLTELAATPNPPDSAGESAASEEQAVGELCLTMGITGDGVDLVRALEMAAMFAKFSSMISTLVWATWKTIAPLSSVRRGGISQKTLARFVSGDPNTSREQAAGELERLRLLVAALISAISQVGDQFARTHLDKFSPIEIENAVRAEGTGGMFKSKEALCWRKYVELAESLDQAAIEAEIRRVIAHHAEQLLKEIGQS